MKYIYLDSEKIVSNDHLIHIFLSSVDIDISPEILKSSIIHPIGN